MPTISHSSKNSEIITSCPRKQLAPIGQSWNPVLYTLIQSFFTWLTGKAYSEQQPLFASSKGYELITSVASLVGGVAVSNLVCFSFPCFFPLLLISWLFTVGGARAIAISINHYCIHGQFFGDHRDRILAEVLSSLIMTQGFDGYKQDHVKSHHHIDKFATFEGDPDAKFILAVGFRPGLKNHDNQKTEDLKHE